MSYDETNKGAIWGNDKKETDRHPDFKGHVNVDGKEYWVAAWKRGPNDNPKAPALRFALTPKDNFQSAGGQGFNQPNTQNGGANSQGGDFTDIDEDLPF